MPSSKEINPHLVLEPGMKVCPRCNGFGGIAWDASGGMSRSCPDCEESGMVLEKDYDRLLEGVIADLEREAQVGRQLVDDGAARRLEDSLGREGKAIPAEIAEELSRGEAMRYPALADIEKAAGQRFSKTSIREELERTRRIAEPSLTERLARWAELFFDQKVYTPNAEQITDAKEALAEYRKLVPKELGQ